MRRQCDGSRRTSAPGGSGRASGATGGGSIDRKPLALLSRERPVNYECSMHIMHVVTPGIRPGLMPGVRLNNRFHLYLPNFTHTQQSSREKHGSGTA
eukprot:COSAG06_NODE_3307_length_5528_cov_105.042918_8_plen_97_part_00